MIPFLTQQQSATTKLLSVDQQYSIIFGQTNFVIHTGRILHCSNDMPTEKKEQQAEPKQIKIVVPQKETKEGFGQIRTYHTWCDVDVNIHYLPFFFSFSWNLVSRFSFSYSIGHPSSTPISLRIFRWFVLKTVLCRVITSDSHLFIWWCGCCCWHCRLLRCKCYIIRKLFAFVLLSHILRWSVYFSLLAVFELYAKMEPIHHQPACNAKRCPKSKYTKRQWWREKGRVLFCL